MIKSILFGYIRHGLTAGCGYLLAHGLVDQSGEQILISAGLGILGVLWSTGQKVAANYELKLAQKGMPVGMAPVSAGGVAAKS